MSDSIVSCGSRDISSKYVRVKFSKFIIKILFVTFDIQDIPRLRRNNFITLLSEDISVSLMHIVQIVPNCLKN